MSVFLLSVGAEEASHAISASQKTEAAGAVASREAAGSVTTDAAADESAGGLLLVLLGVAGACFAGVAFAILTVGMRKTATENTSPEAIVFFINVMGILFLGPGPWRAWACTGCWPLRPGTWS